MNKQDHYRILKERIDIRDYAGYLGYTVVRKGRYYSLKEHDSVRIDPDKIVSGEIPGRGRAVLLAGAVP